MAEEAKLREEDRVFATGPEHGGKLDAEAFAALYRRSITDPEAFWRDEAHRLEWSRFPTRIREVDFSGEVTIRWFADGRLNACHNCLDRHLPARAEQTAIIFEGDEPGEGRRITYAELHAEVCRMANVLKKLGVGRGDRVGIYM
ncbi:MAG: acetyl-coenzyme A synthetase, partial [Alphaproteobacteria bacterium]